MLPAVESHVWLKFFYVIGKVLSCELSCTGTDLVYIKNCLYATVLEAYCNRTLILIVYLFQLSQVADGMAYLHSTNPPILHRDLRCGNLFVTDNDVIKVGLELY